ncbi:hypothetical protein BJ138DRAFT_394115 [Hygrophoropsis aurantiaca]|uniref:Uncharacterized protein n=1 Tax=Hygrophoropsis aurantiaca TaxID=72124 RepID=A0ACB8A553_9AGAM|nr:hypothetical protein BJ138DRAFT_394115 [Hygrophoropsis aurantiaca]
MLARYLPFALVFPLLALLEPLNLDASIICPVSSQIGSWLNIIGIGAAEALLLIRTWVLWGRSRVVLIGLIALGSACIAGDIIANVLPFHSIEYEILPSSISPLSPCFQLYNPPSYAWDYVSLTFFELARMSHHSRHSRIFLMMRDDILYVLCILGISIVNIIIVNAIPDHYANLGMLLQLVIHSVLSSRLLISLRQIMQQQQFVGSGVYVVQPSDLEMLPIAFSEPPSTTLDTL